MPHRRLHGTSRIYTTSASDNEVKEAIESAADTIRSLPGLAMRPDRGAVDHLQRVQFTAAIGQTLQQDIPYAKLTPAAELPPRRIPVAERLRQVAPWCADTADPENTIQHPPMVGWRAPATQRRGGKERLDDRPFLLVRYTVAKLTDCGPLANSRFHHRPVARHQPPSKLEAAYHRADKAIQQIVDLLAA